MQITNVSIDDGKMCAHVLSLLQLAGRLLDALRLAGLPVSGPGVDQKEQAYKWMLATAELMARAMQAEKKAEADSKPMSVAAIGSPQPLTSSKRLKKKAK